MVMSTSNTSQSVTPHPKGYQPVEELKMFDLKVQFYEVPEKDQARFYKAIACQNMKVMMKDAGSEYKCVNMRIVVHIANYHPLVEVLIRKRDP